MQKRVPRITWTARRSNQSILKEISPGCSLEGMMLKLKLQYFGHLMHQEPLATLTSLSHLQLQRLGGHLQSLHPARVVT